MAKKVKGIVKLQIEGGKATPAPPIGPALAQYGVNMGQFCQEFNDRTKERAGTTVPVEITIFEGGAYEFILKKAPASELLLKAAGIEKGSGSPKKKKVGKINREKLKEIAEEKMDDLNTENIEAAMRIIEGTAKNMGIEIKD